VICYSTVAYRSPAPGPRTVFASVSTIGTSSDHRDGVRTMPRWDCSLVNQELLARFQCHVRGLVPVGDLALRPPLLLLTDQTEAVQGVNDRLMDELDR
jgi:hypothetical protein